MRSLHHNSICCVKKLKTNNDKSYCMNYSVRVEYEKISGPIAEIPEKTNHKTFGIRLA